MKLTGNTRHTLRWVYRWFRAPRYVMVLQVEVEYIHTYNIGGFIDSEWRKEWRDARFEDIDLAPRPVVH